MGVISFLILFFDYFNLIIIYVYHLNLHPAKNWFLKNLISQKKRTFCYFI